MSGGQALIMQACILMVERSMASPSALMSLVAMALRAALRSALCWRTRYVATKLSQCNIPSLDDVAFGPSVTRYDHVQDPAFGWTQLGHRCCFAVELYETAHRERGAEPNRFE